MTGKITDSGSAGQTHSSAKENVPAVSSSSPFISYREIPPEVFFPASALQLINKIARTKIPLLILGEQGLGQDYLSNLLHEAGVTKGEPFLDFHVATHKSDDALEELYHLLQTLDSGKPFRGTLHINGIENSSHLLQTCLLSMLAHSPVRLPDGRQLYFQGRITAGMFQTMEQGMAQQGCLMPSLAYKLAVAPIFLKPLRERSNDIPRLVDMFTMAYAKHFAITDNKFSPEAVKLLQDYYWPGNMGEFESVIYRSLLFSPCSYLQSENILFSAEPLRIVPAEEPAKVFSGNDPLAAAYQLTDGPSLELSVAQLVAELSHEIKNPLVAIKTFIQLLPGHINDPEFLSDFFGVAATSIDRIDYLTERMLEFAKLSQPHFGSVALSFVLQEAIKQTGPLKPPLQINWDKSAFEQLPALYTDQEQVRYALGNILFHIAHNTSAGHIIECRAEATPATITLCMSYGGEKQAQGLAFSTSQGALIDDLNGLDLFLAQQVLQKNAVRCKKDTAQDTTTIAIQFLRQEGFGRR